MRENGTVMKIEETAAQLTGLTPFHMEPGTTKDYFDAAAVEGHLVLPGQCAGHAGR